MNKINLKAYLKKRKQKISVSGISPKFDWWLILILAGTLFACGVVYASYLYININNNSLFENEEVQNVEQETDLQKVKIKKTLEILKERNFDESAVN